MRTKTAVASIVLLAVVMGCVVWSDLRSKAVIADEVDRVYLQIGDKPDHVGKGLLEDADRKISRYAGRIMLLPKSSSERAATLIGAQLSALSFAKEHIDKQLAKMGNGNALMDAEWQKYIDRETESYASQVPKFKAGLSYIRRSL